MRVKKCSLLDFRKQFATELDCATYLIDQKWQTGYRCRKCKHTEFKKGEVSTDRRCKRCNYNESPTAHTIFHSIKMPLVIAFEMVYRISVSKKGISSIALCREYAVNLKTAYNFKFKVQQSLKSSGINPLIGIVHVDEFVYGGEEEGCQGRSSESEKLKICVAVEIVLNKKGEETMGRAYALPIENYSSKELKKIFEKHISKEAQITTDKWSGYKPLQKEYNIKQVLSENGANFPCIHNLILNIKSWIRGIHHSISKSHLHHYLNEFCFRFNRRNWMENMPIFALNKMIATTPKPVGLSKRGFYG
jgi:transposase-like protein